MLRCILKVPMWLGAACLLVILWVTHAPAQSVANSYQDAQLEEVIVTATRRSESDEKIPLSIIAYNEAALDKAGIKNITDLATLTPGIQFDNQTGLGAGSVTNIAIRGVEPTAGASTTGIYIDDTAIQGRLTNASAFGNPYPNTFDLERVEVLKGPQGTLFGAGSEGGAVRFIQTQPGFDNYSGKAVVEVSTTKSGDPSYEAGVAGGGPIVPDTLAFRASAWYRNDGGYIERVDPFTLATVQSNSNYSESSSARFALAYRPVDEVTITPSIYWQRVFVNDTSAFYEYLSSKDDLKNGRLLRQPANDSFYLGSIKLDAHLGFANLVAISSYFDRHGKTLNDLTSLMGVIGASVSLPLGNAGYGDPRGPAFPTSYADAAPQYGYITQRIASQEIRLTSSDPNARLTWVAGLYYSHAHQEDPNYLYDYLIPNPPATSQPVLFQNPIETDKQTAIFGQADYAIWRGLKFTAGVRVARSTVNAEEAATGFIAGNPQCCYFQNATETPVTPRFALSYQADEKSLYYVSGSKGYRLGGGNLPTGMTCKEIGPLSYQSDSLWSYEIGAKNRLFDDHLQLDISAFHVNWSNIQQNILLADCGAQYVTNAGKAVSNGFDLSTQVLLTSQLRGLFSLAYQNAHFTQTITSVGGSTIIVQSGDAVGALPQVPSPWNATLTLEYDFRLADRAMFVRGEDVFRSRNNGPFPTQIPGGFSYEPDLRPNPNTNALNLRFGADFGSYNASLFVNNVLNSQPWLGRWVDATGSSLFTDGTLRPLTVGLNLTARF
jgi:iron complex outermembrane receptor protein